MSEADEMLKKLGYKKIEVDDAVTGTILMYDKETEKSTKKRISIFKDKSIQCSKNYLYVAKIDIQELIAISKKVIELLKENNEK